MRKHLGLIGGALTVIYLAVMVALVWSRASTLLTMPLNEVGDFLAGAFGPVAFLWLVLGFLQQGEELRQGTEALKLQANELRHSVEQQSIMAKAATEQISTQKDAWQHQLAEKDNALKAHFTMRTGVSATGSIPGTYMNRIQIKNDGGHAYRVHIKIDPPFADLNEFSAGDFHRGAVGDMEFQFPVNTAPSEGTLQLTYEDIEGNLRRDEYDLTSENNRISLVKKRPSPGHRHDPEL